MLNQEELRAARISNQVRYVLAGLILIPVLTAVASNTERLEDIGAFVGFSIYVTLTVIHTLFLRRRGDDAGAVNVFNHLAVVLDVTLIAGLIVYYFIITATDNFAFVLKNPVRDYLFLPLMMALLQFRGRLVWFTLCVLLLTHYGLIGYGLYSGMPLGQSWKEYVLGQSVILSDVLVARPVVFISAALLISFAIRRAIRMTASIGDIEAQKALLSRYFAPSVVSEIARGSQALSRGRKQEVSVLFLDIRNFTRVTEAAEPEEVVRALSLFRDRMAAIIFDHGGTLDKFIGDAIMANFGTPDPSPQPGRDARNAVEAARRMLRAVDEINAQGRWLPGQVLEIGIGIHCGPVFAGQIGSDAMLEYTVIGDTVNTASRIESLCKKLDRPLLVSGAVRAHLPQGLRIESLPRVRVKGKSEPLILFSVSPGD